MKLTCSYGDDREKNRDSHVKNTYKNGAIMKFKALPLRLRGPQLRPMCRYGAFALLVTGCLSTTAFADGWVSYWNGSGPVTTQILNLGPDIGGNNWGAFGVSGNTVAFWTEPTTGGYSTDSGIVCWNNRLR